MVSNVSREISRLGNDPSSWPRSWTFWVPRGDRQPSKVGAAVDVEQAPLLPSNASDAASAAQSTPWAAAPAAPAELARRRLADSTAALRQLGATVQEADCQLNRRWVNNFSVLVPATPGSTQTWVKIPLSKEAFAFSSAALRQLVFKQRADAALAGVVQRSTEVEEMVWYHPAASAALCQTLLAWLYDAPPPPTLDEAVELVALITALAPSTMKQPALLPNSRWQTLLHACDAIVYEQLRADTCENVLQRALTWGTPRYIDAVAQWMLQVLPQGVQLPWVLELNEAAFTALLDSPSLQAQPDFCATYFTRYRATRKSAFQQLSDRVLCARLARDGLPDSSPDNLPNSLYNERELLAVLWTRLAVPNAITPYSMTTAAPRWGNILSQLEPGKLGVVTANLAYCTLVGAMLVSYTAPALPGAALGALIGSLDGLAFYALWPAAAEHPEGPLIASLPWTFTLGLYGVAVIYACIVYADQSPNDVLAIRWAAGIAWGLGGLLKYYYSGAAGSRLLHASSEQTRHLAQRATRGAQKHHDRLVQCLASWRSRPSSAAAPRGPSLAALKTSGQMVDYQGQSVFGNMATTLQADFHLVVRRAAATAAQPWVALPVTRECLSYASETFKTAFLDCGAQPSRGDHFVWEQPAADLATVVTLMRGLYFGAFAPAPCEALRLLALISYLDPPSGETRLATLQTTCWQTLQTAALITEAPELLQWLQLAIDMRCPPDVLAYLTRLIWAQPQLDVRRLDAATLYTLLQAPETSTEQRLALLLQWQRAGHALAQLNLENTNYTLDPDELTSLEALLRAVEARLLQPATACRLLLARLEAQQAAAPPPSTHFTNVLHAALQAQGLPANHFA